MYYGTVNGERFPKEIYNRLGKDKQKEFIEIDDDTMKTLVNKANETNCDIVPDENGNPSLQARVVDEAETISDQISSYKRYLSQTDWYVTKCYELGLSMIEKYPEIYNLRADARTQINVLESRL